MYRAHNYHILIYAAMLAGQFKVALNTAARLEHAIPEDLLRIEPPPMAMFLESFVPMRVHIFVRFGRREGIIDLTVPQDQVLYFMTTTSVDYSKVIAFGLVPPTRMLHNNTCVDILAVAVAMLDGELEYRRGDVDLAFQYVHRSIDLYDKLPYDEPRGWMQLARHVYGALLLDQGFVAEAAEVYDADLGIDDIIPRAKQHPNNVWSLHGYLECLVKLGRQAAASIIRPQLRFATATVDVKIHSSCFCRLNTSTIGTGAKA
ncbi:hypothetical protein FQN54_009149 [Arachnomyces sp. PD_36]|nr:hypothetical protein FQN54_009149 [Arachnomyces sp. PD_36]